MRIHRFNHCAERSTQSLMPEMSSGLNNIVKEKGPADRTGFEKLLQLMRAEYAEAATAAKESFEKGAERSMEIRRKLSEPGGSDKERLALANEQLVLQQRAFLHKPAGGSRKQSLLQRAFTFEICDRWWPAVVSGICRARRGTRGFARPAGDRRATIRGSTELH